MCISRMWQKEVIMMMIPVTVPQSREQTLVSCLQQVAAPSFALSPFFFANLPLSPSVNANYKPFMDARYAFPRLVNTSVARAYKEELALLLPSLAEVNHELLALIHASKKKIPLAVDLHFYYPTLWRRDIDNGEKILIDCIFHYLQVNDNRIVDKHSLKSIDRVHPHVEVSVRCLTMQKGA